MHSSVDILLVDDNPDDVDLTLFALREHDLAGRTKLVRDGAEALDFVFCTGAYQHRNVEDRPRLILLDLKLPKIDGLEVLRHLKSDPRTRSIPVVVLTTSRQTRDIHASYQAGVNSYIVKSVDFDQFSEATRQLGQYWLFLNEPPT